MTPNRNQDSRNFSEAGSALRRGPSAWDGAVVLSPFYWNFHDDMWQTTHHIACQLALRLPTIFVEPPAQWNPHSAEFRFHRLPPAVFAPRWRAAGRQLTVLRRRGFPCGRFPAIRIAQAHANARALRRLIARLGWRRILLWHSFPYDSEPFVEAVCSDFHVYHCLDFSPREEERQLAGRADVVFGVSKALVDRLGRWNPRTDLLPNGVDIELFDPGTAAGAPRPRDLPAKSPVLGFLGYVNYHVDLELLLKLARAFPQHTVVLLGRVPTGHTAPVGRQRAALQTLATLPNVRILGFRPTAQLAAYLQSFDLCLIPFLVNPFNQQCDPLKFYQYLAMSKRIVSTPVSVACAHRDICRVAQTHEEFLAAVDDELGQIDTEARRRARRAVAEAHSWPALFDRAWQTIERRRLESREESHCECM